MTYQQIADKWGTLVDIASKKHGVRSTLILAVIRQESSGLENAISPAKCYGLMQISKFALADYNGNNGTATIDSELFIPEVNIEIGTWYLRWLIRTLKSEFDALRAYNIGIGTVKKGKTLFGSDGTKYASSVLDHELQFISLTANKTA